MIYLFSISLEEWEEKRKEKYNILYNTVRENLPSIWLPMEFALSRSPNHQALPYYESTSRL